jgi:tRNA A37 threonylcarbamoyladenosine modification protein TsaB
LAAGALEVTTDLANEVLNKASLKFKDVKSYAVCIGPGSMLGIRVAAMAGKNLGNPLSATYLCLGVIESFS